MKTMAGKKRTDSKGRVLKDNELQRKDGSYMFRYRNEAGDLKTEYAWKLVPTDKTPKGKRDGLSLREKEDLIQQDKFFGIDSSAKKKITLNQEFDKYMEGKTELKQSTRVNYLYMYNHYVRDTIGKRKLADIKFSDIKSFYNSLIKDKGFKPNSMEIIHTILHPTFTLAVRDDIIFKNPTEGVMSEIKKSHSWEKPKRHALTEEQQTAFIKYMAESETYKHWLPMFTCFLGTGCRVGELIGLRWQDCDFKNNVISINHNLIYRQNDNGISEMHITTPKTNAGIRTIPMLTEVRKALNEERKKQLAEGFSDCEIDGYTGFVFTNRFGYVHNPMAINRAIKRIYEAHNEEERAKAIEEHREPIIIPHFSVHNLRHTFCTRFCENETNLKIIQEIMGHSDIATTMNIYNEATENKKQEAFQNLDSKIKIS
jgi:integrase